MKEVEEVKEGRRAGLGWELVLGRCRINEESKHGVAKMRRYLARGLILSILSLVTTTVTADEKSKTGWKVVERLEYDWNQDGSPDSFTLEIPAQWDAGGDSTRLTIQISGGPRFVLRNKLGWMDFVEDAILQSWSKTNIVNSRHFLFLPKDMKPGGTPLLILFGWPYGSSPGTLHVLDLDANGTPRVAFFRKQFEFTGFADLNGDARSEIVGKPCLSQEYGNGLLTYDPYHVYVLPGHGRRARLSMVLSKQYNLEHYFGWAGPECSEKLAVVLHPPGGGKPVIMKAKDAERLPEVEKPTPNW